MFVLPHVIIGPYQPVTTHATTASRAVQECVVNNNTSTTGTCFSGYESNRFYLVLFCVAQLLMGAGTTPLFSLAPAYIDENVHPKSSPVYLSLFFAAAITGPGLGYIAGGVILNNVFVQVTQVSCQYRKITSSNNTSLNWGSYAAIYWTRAALILFKRYQLTWVRLALWERAHALHNAVCGLISVELWSAPLPFAAKTKIWFDLFWFGLINSLID